MILQITEHAFIDIQLLYRFLYLLSLPGLTLFASIFLAGQQDEGHQQGAGPQQGS